METFQGFGIGGTPPGGKVLGGAIGQRKSSGVADPVKSSFYVLLMLAADGVQDISDLMSPAALHRDMGIDERESGF